MSSLYTAFRVLKTNNEICCCFASISGAGIAHSASSIVMCSDNDQFKYDSSQEQNNFLTPKTSTPCLGGIIQTHRGLYARG